MKKLLLIDDDEHIHNAVSMIFCPPHYEITVCTATSQAIKKILCPGGTDIILADIALSEYDSGLEFIRLARKKGIDTPIVVLTAMTDIDVIIEAYRAGATDVVRKPHLASLKQIVNDIIARGQKK